MYLSFVVAAFLGVFTLTAATASAGTSCPSGYTCVSANKTTVKSSKSSSMTKIVIKKTIKEQIVQYERVRHVTVGFSMMPNGLPKAEQGDCKWGDFEWSGWTTVNGTFVYVKNAPHGRTHACLVGKYWRQIGGGPGQWNCGNVVVPYGQTPSGRIVEKVIAFKTRASFESTYHKWVSKKSKSTSSTKTKYSCSRGWKLHGTVCMRLTPLPPSSICTIAGAVNYGQAGNCVYQSNTAEQTCEADKGTWNGNTNLCTIIQINANCSTVYVINGSGNVVSGPTQSGNCNTTPTPTPTCQSPGATNEGGSLPCVFPPPPPTVTSVLSIQEMDTTSANATSEESIPASVVGPSGDSLKVVYTACYGSFPSGDTTYTTGTGSPVTVSVVYEAPTEVPPGTACSGVPAGYDQITVNVYDQTTGLNDLTQSDGKNVSTFQIVQPVASPS